MQKKMIMLIDTRTCFGCGACVIVCKTENQLSHGSFRDWLSKEENGSRTQPFLEFRSERCNHCESASCITNCPTGASYRAEDGTVQIDKDRCTGCKDCLSACAYSARYVHDQGHVDKCTFCSHRDDTACEAVCPSSSINFGDANDPDSKVSSLLLNNKFKVLKPESGFWPKVYYLV